MSDPRDGSNSVVTAPDSELVMDVQEANAKYLPVAERQIPKGYKQTEVGVIPGDWNIACLETLVNPKRPISYGIVQTGPNIPNGIRCLRVLDISNGKINNTDLLTTTDEISESYKRTVLKFGDLVMPLRGNVGDVGLIDNELAGCNLTRGLALIAIRSEWSASFCRQFISSSQTRARLEQAMNGSALQEIPIASLRTFKIALPPTKTEQEAIAEALSDADALIEALEQLVAKKRQLKQGAMQELLTGKRRLPGFEIKTGLKETELGLIPKDWEVKSLGQIANIATGSTPPTTDPTNYGDEFLFVSPVDLGFKKYILQTEKMLSKKGFAISRLFPKGSILFVCIGSTIGKCGIASLDLTSNQQINAIFPASEFSTDYVYYAVSAISSNIKALAGEQAVPIVNKTQFSEAFISIPISNAEQTAIAQILSDMDAEIAELDTTLTKARAVKQGMMQQLLTGKIRLVVNPKPIIDN